MNRSQAKALLPLIQAFVDGADIQVRDGLNGGTWMTLRHPDFSWDVTQYRIKPVPREFWIDVVTRKVFLTKKGAVADTYALDNIIRVREVFSDE